jgi:hypothetical protein
VISAPPQTTNISPSSTALCLAKSPISLTSITLTRLWLQPGVWRSLIGAVDFPSLERLAFRHSNFSYDQLKALVDRIDEVCSDPVLLKKVTIQYSKLDGSARTRTLRAKLDKKFPSMLTIH